MKIPSDPKEKFQYYFDVTTGLDGEYQEKIDKINAGEFKYEPENSYQYKKAVRQNAENAELLKKKKTGSYAAYSEGYDNSMQKVYEKNIEAEKERLNNETYKKLYNNEYNKWVEDKKQRINSAMKRYARTYGNAYYNMLKANEEITFENAKTE